MKNDRKKAIREFIDSFDECRVVTGQEIPEDFGSLPKYRQESYYFKTNSFYVVSKKEEGSLFLGCYITRVYKGQKGYYLKSETVDSLTIKDYKIVKPISGEVIDLFPKQMQRLLKDLNGSFLIRLCNSRRLLTDLISGKIYNMETIIKAVLANSYHCKDLNWKFAKNASEYRFREVMNYYPVWTNINEAVRLFGLPKDKSNMLDIDNDCFSLVEDTLKMAFLLDRKVNPLWSEKRFRQEHDNMADILTKFREDLLDTSDIHQKDFTENENSIHLINSEKDIYNEGKKMGHCLFSCYRNEILNKEYLAFALEAPERCTLGVKVNPETKLPYIDQVSLFRNGKVSEETRAFAEEFVTSHSEEISQLFETGSNIRNSENLPF